MLAKQYFEYLQEEIHSVIAATVDDYGQPVTCAIDIMDYDGDSLYFLTARGKGFYERLKKREYMALTGMKGEDTMSCVAVSVRGKVRELGDGLLPRLFEKNPYMGEIYPTEQSRKALTVFQLYEGNGEWFDLSKKPVERMTFTFGNAREYEQGYFITDSCTGCGKCEEVCPQGCIDDSSVPAVIRQEHCLHCGCCAEICPEQAVQKKS